MAAGVPAGQAGSKQGPVCPAGSVCMDRSPTVHCRDICFLAAGFDILLLFVFWQNRRVCGFSQVLLPLIYLLSLHT